MSLRDQPAATVAVAVIDLELTGLDAERDRVCEIAIVRTEGGVVTQRVQHLVRPPVSMSEEATRVTGIRDEDLASARTFDAVADEVIAAMSGAVLVAHNVETDRLFLEKELRLAGRETPITVTVDTLWMARRLFAFRSNRLYDVADKLGLRTDRSHRALGDAELTREVLARVLEIVDPAGTMTVGELNDLLSALAPNSPLRLRQKRTLRRAYGDRQTVIIDYQDTQHPARGLVRREVGIWLLRLPYLQAWCYLRQAERVFRLDRIRVVREAARPYEIPVFKPRI